MIYEAGQLNKKLTHLTLTGMDDGDLEWTGTEEEWDKTDCEPCDICMKHNCECDRVYQEYRDNQL